MALKVTGGTLRGRRISRKGLGKASPHGALRATSSKVREAIFNIIGPRMEDAVFLDLYAGSGAVGTEAMSRKAARVFFVEAEAGRVAGIEELLRGCSCRERAVILREKALDFLRRAASHDMRFDIVFLDPPYASGELELAIPLLGEGGALADDALVIAEHMKKTALPDEAGVLIKHKTYRYGDTHLTLYRKAR